MNASVTQKASRSELALILDFVYEHLTDEEVRSYYKHIAFVPKILRYEELKGITVGQVCHPRPALLVATDISIVEIITSWGRAGERSRTSYAGIGSVVYGKAEFPVVREEVASPPTKVTLLSEMSLVTFFPVLTDELTLSGLEISAWQFQLLSVLKQHTASELSNALEVEENAKRRYEDSEERGSEKADDGVADTLLDTYQVFRPFMPKSNSNVRKADTAIQAWQIKKAMDKGDGMDAAVGMANMFETKMKSMAADYDRKSKSRSNRSRSSGRRR